MFRYIYRIRCVCPAYMRRNTIVMIEDFNALFGSTNVDFLTNKFIRNRVLAIPNSYEIIGLYGGS